MKAKQGIFLILIALYGCSLCVAEKEDTITCYATENDYLVSATRSYGILLGKANQNNTACSQDSIKRDLIGKLVYCHHYKASSGNSVCSKCVKASVEKFPGSHRPEDRIVILACEGGKFSEEDYSCRSKKRTIQLIESSTSLRKPSMAKAAGARDKFEYALKNPLVDFKVKGTHAGYLRVVSRALGIEAATSVLEKTTAVLLAQFTMGASVMVQTGAGKLATALWNKVVTKMSEKLGKDKSVLLKAEGIKCMIGFDDEAVLSTMDKEFIHDILNGKDLDVAEFLLEYEKTMASKEDAEAILSNMVYMMGHAAL